jgi:hypothetical protein
LFQGSGTLLLLLGVVVVVGFVFIMLIGSMLSAVYRVMVFRYAQTGLVPGNMDESLLKAAFKSK